MDEHDLIVVDDVDESRPVTPIRVYDTETYADAEVEDEAPEKGDNATYVPRRPMRAAAQQALANNMRRLSDTHSRSGSVEDLSTPGDRGMRTRPKLQPKLKLKLSEKLAAQAPGMSFLGPYDRELDSDEEELAFEEQFILRMPPGEDCERLHKMVSSREVGSDVWFKFKDSRRATFHIGNSTYSAKLVDLPCIIESQKTLDNKQMFKVADICQMLAVEDRIEKDQPSNNDRNFNVDEFIWPHGITPPLHHARKRRFRKRVNKRTIENVEQEVERLLEEDAMATKVQYEVLENVNPDLSDSEFIERDDSLANAATPVAESDAGDAPTPGGDIGEPDEDEDEEADGEIDEELAAELDLALGDEEDEEDDDDDDDDDDDSDADEEEEDEDEDEDDNEGKQARKLLNEEIRDLEAAVAKKHLEIGSSTNPLIRKRFEDALKKLAADLEMKTAQRDELKEKQRLRKEGIDLDQPVDGANEGTDGEEDLFGGSDAGGMELD